MEILGGGGGGATEAPQEDFLRPPFGANRKRNAGMHFSEDCAGELRPRCWFFSRIAYFLLVMKLHLPQD